ncbi:hypothetical protein HPT27_11730 [Permianibacter sp. IMCC34836]|uniref:pilus assembly PilX family protein n=1 Tax=Permianibacter fluminis TaxID=2738515 RepID=UPI001553DAE6|nr:PilX N-terminal domain-containing pilus assembly protein [Permianibacter fluminis]NQD37696.1 hypothetical protein [Permianibacter fluminis]
MTPVTRKFRQQPMTQQQGAALFVSLVILLVLSIIGISAMRGGLLQSLMASNTQQVEVATSVADAGVSATWALTTEELLQDGGVLNTASETPGGATYFVDNTGNLSANETMIDSDRDTPVLTSQVVVSHVGPATAMCSGYSMTVNTSATSAECHGFRVNGTGTVGDVNSTVSGWLVSISASNSAAIP